MLATRKLDWATFFVALLLWQHVGCLASPATFVVPHLASMGLGALGGNVKITIGGSTDTSSQPRMSDAEVARWRSCIKSVAANDPGMQAITKMLTTIYMCALTNKAGCISMVRAQKLPFTSANDMTAALENAAKQVSSCAASSGRGLKGWGADMLDGNWDLSVEAIKGICSTAAAMLKAGILSPEMEKASHLDLETKVWAALAGIARSFLSIITKRPSIAWVLDDRIGFVMMELVQTNKAKCQEYFGDKSCKELRDGAWDKALQAWADDSAKSTECKQCAADMVAQCEKMTDNLIKEFKDTMDGFNLLTSLFGNLGGIGSGLFKGTHDIEVTMDTLWNIFTFFKEELQPIAPAQPSGSTATASNDQQTQAPATGVLSGLTQATQNQGRNCAAVAGTYELSAKRWVADNSNTDNKQCQHSKSITIFPDCRLHLKDEEGYESKYHGYIPGSPIGCGEVFFSKDWQRKVHWDMRQALSGGLPLFCVDRSTRKILGEWYYSIPNWDKCAPTPTPSGATNQARPACTNKVEKNDGCRGGERVWCCAGVNSASELKMPCILLGPAGTTRLCPASETPMRYCCPFTQNPGPLTEPVATTASQPAPSADTYTVGGTAYTLCTRPLNMPVGGGMGVRMVGTDDCVNCGAYPCPQKMTCKPGKASPTQAPEMAFATCV